MAIGMIAFMVACLLTGLALMWIGYIWYSLAGYRKPRRWNL